MKLNDFNVGFRNMEKIGMSVGHRTPQDLNDLRIVILEDDYDPTPEEMLSIVNQNRQDRRKAAMMGEASKTRTGSSKSRKAKSGITDNFNTEDLRAILDQEFDK